MEQWQTVLNVVMYLFIHKSQKMSWGPHFSGICCHITGQSVSDISKEQDSFITKGIEQKPVQHILLECAPRELYF